jgi:hypothetical protein
MAYCSQSEVVIDIKEFLFLFSKTMEVYSYDVSQLIDFFDSMKETYSELAINEGSKKFSRVNFI